MSSSNSSNPSTTIEWGFFKKLWVWFGTFMGVCSVLGMVILIISIMGRVLPTYKISHTELGPPDYLYEGDTFYLNDNIIPPPKTVVTITLVSGQPFSLKLDESPEQRIVDAVQEFDQKYWIKGLAIKHQGFRITKATKSIYLYTFDRGNRGIVNYSMESRHGYPIINKTWWYATSWVIRMLLGAFIGITFLVWAEDSSN